MLQAVLLDLDDTLYPEQAYLLSGFAVAADRIASLADREQGEVLALLIDIERRQGRGRVFDTALERLGIEPTRERIDDLVQLYRRHRPSLAPYPGVVDLLARLRRRFRTAIVTDGLPEMQRAKIEALGFASMVDATVYTWEIGAPKPNLRGFLAALDALQAEPSRAVVVGDNPLHDQAAAHAIRAFTIRIRSGRFESLATPRGIQPGIEISSVGDLEAAIEQIESGTFSTTSVSPGNSAHVTAA